EDANSTKVPIAKLADKIAGVFVPVVIGISLLSLAIWLIIGKEFSFAVNIAVSVLVVSCPCALGLATPAALMAGTGKAAEYGILIKSGEALQKTASADVVVLDKTGTITYGKPQVENVEITGKITEAEFLATAVALEKMSSHILGKAVIEYAEKKGVEGYAAENFEAIKGLGIKGVVNGKECLLGNRNFAIGETPDEDGKKLIELAEKEVGATVLFMSIDGEKSGYMSIKDGIKPSSREAIAELKAMNKEVVMLTGDNKSAARAVADELGISYEAEVLPDRKYEVVNALKKDGKTVMMVGDGVNDAPALSAADIGVAIGAGADIAIDSADVVLIKSDLGDVVKTIKTGVKVMRNIKENLFWAFFYNVILIPVACGVLYPVGGEKLLLNPMFASLAMSLSSVCVVGNALRLRFIKFGKSDERGAERNQPKKVEGIKPIEKADNKNVGDGSAKGGEKVETAKMTIYIDGMMCEHCKKRVETALSGIGLTAEVSLQNKCAYITDGEAEDGAIKIAISDAGYSVTEIVR
ncbi:MAG: metal-transporting ATPase, partial [Clostridia bacterium]|nr:metal-transporting ATPase [Clostridia bacterium]